VLAHLKDKNEGGFAVLEKSVYGEGNRKLRKGWRPERSERLVSG
jgi:hypothetical protein